MAGFLDVLLRGLALVAACVALGGVAWVRFVLAPEPYAKPDAPVRLALRTIAVAAFVLAVTQAALIAVALGALADTHGGWPVTLYFETGFSRVAAARGVLALGIVALALRLSRAAAGPWAWMALALGTTAVVASSAVLGHAIARMHDRAILVTFDAVHQLAAAAWVGGLVHMVVYAASIQDEDREPVIVSRFSRIAFSSVLTLSAAGVGLTVAYVGDLGGFIGTAYGVMILSKVVLFAGAVGFAAANWRLVGRGSGIAGPLRRYVEVEVGLAITVIFAAASLTSLPPAVDVVEDRATVAEVAARFTPALPRLASPPADELNRSAEPLMAIADGQRLEIERAWSEFNHHWAGFFVLVMGLGAIAERLGVRWARHWPLGFLGLAIFMFLRNDPRAWPLGPAGFWESFMLPDVLQHRLFVVLTIAFGVFEWAVRTGRLRPRPWGYVFPLLCAVGGGLLLTHSHAMFNLKEEFLTEVTHAPIGLLGAFAGWGRWLELRLPEESARAGWLWTLCFAAVGVVLLVYREG